MPKALNNEVHALLSEAKKLENSEIVLGRSLKGYDSTFTYSHIHLEPNCEKASLNLQLLCKIEMISKKLPLQSPLAI